MHLLRGWYNDHAKLVVRMSDLGPAKWTPEPEFAHVIHMVLFALHAYLVLRAFLASDYTTRWHNTYAQLPNM